jgi:hypothetical protein
MPSSEHNTLIKYFVSIPSVEHLNLYDYILGDIKLLTVRSQSKSLRM